MYNVYGQSAICVCPLRDSALIGRSPDVGATPDRAHGRGGGYGLTTGRDGGYGVLGDADGHHRLLRAQLVSERAPHTPHMMRMGTARLTTPCVCACLELPSLSPLIRLSSPPVFSLPAPPPPTSPSFGTPSPLFPSFSSAYLACYSPARNGWARSRRRATRLLGLLGSGRLHSMRHCCALGR